MVRRAARSGLRRKKGAIVALSTAPPDGSVKSFPGRRLVRQDAGALRRGRATQEIDYGRRGSGYVFGAFVPATGAVLTAPYPRCTTAHWVACLEHVDAWLESDQIPSHWQNMSTGRWAQEECNRSNYRTEAVTSARFKNEDFVLRDQLNDPAWVYYDGVLARASTTTSRGSLQYGIVSTWQEGCAEALGWAGFRTYPGEYNNINPV